MILGQVQSDQVFQVLEEAEIEVFFSLYLVQGIVVEVQGLQRGVVELLGYTVVDVIVCQVEVAQGGQLGYKVEVVVYISYVEGLVVVVEVQGFQSRQFRKRAFMVQVQFVMG